MLRSLGPVTRLLLGFNVLVYLLGLGWDMASGTVGSWQVEGGFWSARVNAELFNVIGPLPRDYDWFVPVWLTPVTSAFLHAGLLHLAMNMLVLVFTGSRLERVLGSNRLALLYAAGIVAAAAAHFAADPSATVPVVGASGAISALLATYFVLFPRRLPRPLGPIPARTVQIVWLAAAWIGINLLAEYAFSTTAFGVAIYAHIGGFLAGLALALPLGPRRPLPPWA